MRSDIITYLRQLRLKNFGISEELPFQADQELYLKNVKKMYVSAEDIEVTAHIALLNSPDIDQAITTLSVYFSTDAKQLPTDYYDVLKLVILAKDSIPVAHGFRKDATVSTEIVKDIMVTKVEFKFTALL